MKTYKTILLMMLFALLTLSSCDKDDTDLTGDVIINTYGDYFTGGSFEIYTEEAALADGSNSSLSYPRPIREGHLNEEAIVEGLNHGTYYLLAYPKNNNNKKSITFQITGGHTTRINVSNTNIDIDY